MLLVFSVYDSKAEAYGRPFFLTSDGLAMRAFMEAVQSQEHDFAKWPADYTLFRIGSYDEHSGKLAGLDAFVSLGTGVEYKGDVGQLELVKEQK